MYRANPYHLPTIDGMFENARSLFNSSFYGFINSDIILSPTIFDLMQICIQNERQGKLLSNVIEW